MVRIEPSSTPLVKFYLSFFVVLFFLVSNIFSNTVNYVKNIEVTTYAGKVGYSHSRDGNLLHAAFNLPFGICYDENINFLYVLDQGSSKFRVIDTIHGEVKTITSKFTSKILNIILLFNLILDIQMIKPFSCAIDSNSNIYVTDQFRITKVSPPYHSAKIVAGSSQSGFLDAYGLAALFQEPVDISFIPGNSSIFFVADVSENVNQLIRKVDISRDYKVDTPHVIGLIGLVFALAINNVGSNMYVSTTNSPGIFCIDMTLWNATLLITCEYILCFLNALIFCLDTSLGIIDGPINLATINSPLALSIDSNNNLYFIDSTYQTIRFTDKITNVTTIAGSYGNNPFKNIIKFHIFLFLFSWIHGRYWK